MTWYYSFLEARNWINHLSDARSGSPTHVRHPIEGTNGFMQCQLASQAGAVAARDRTQIGSTLTVNDLPLGESLTFASFTFMADKAGRVDVNPLASFARTIFFGALAFVIDRYGDLHVCPPPLQQITSAASPRSTTSSSPNPGLGSAFGLQNDVATYQWMNSNEPARLGRC